MTTDEVSVQDHSSQYYEARYRGFGLRYHQAIIGWLMQHAQGQILDVGCGTGIVSRLYPHLDILGIDLSPGMLRQHPGQYSYMDACQMRLEDASFDFILCRSLLHHLPKHREALQEMYRVLKPGGRIACWETNAGWLAQHVRRWTQHGDRFSEYHHAFTKDELVAGLSEFFSIDTVEHQGFIGYPLWGFPDIVNFQRWLLGKRWLFPMTIAFDDWLSRTPGIRSMSWALGIQAHKT